jgi:menaquinone-dependent protoporphyrinogen IX oxidase
MKIQFLKFTVFHTWALVLCLFLLFSFSCTRGIKEKRFSQEDPSFAMIIASDSSAFKDSIRDKIIRHYQDDGNIELINIKRLKEINPLDYDVVLIIDTTLAWSGFNPSLNTFLENHEYKQNVIVFMTAADPNWTYSYQGVDAITSASVMKNIDVKFEEIRQQIDRCLNLSGDTIKPAS